MAVRTCPVPGCEVPVRPSMLMCREHWYRVPRQLKAAVNQLWQAYNNASVGEMVGAYRDYMSARTAAIASVTPRDHASAATEVQDA